MVHRIIATSAIALFLAGCSITQSDKLPAGNGGMPKYSGFTLVIPKEVSKVIHRTDKSDAYLTFDNTVTTRKPTDFSIWIYPPESPENITACSQAALCTDLNVPNPDSCGCTVAEPQIVEQSENTFTVMGKFAGYPCPVDHCDDTQFGMSQYKGRYVFYSTHEGKTVKIEINQVTDNPQLAEDIFKTFRWTK